MCRFRAARSESDQDHTHLPPDSYCCAKHTAAVEVRRDAIVKYNKEMIAALLRSRFRWIQSCGDALAPLDAMIARTDEILHSLGVVTVEKASLTSALQSDAVLTLEELRKIERIHQVRGDAGTVSVVPLTYYSKEKFIERFLRFLEESHSECFMMSI